MKEQRASAISAGTTEINGVVKDCTKLLEESFEVLTSLQEDLNIQHLEIKACKLQQLYDEMKGTVQMVALTQRLAWMQQAKVLKEQVDVTQHKEGDLKEHVQPWIDEALVIIALIEARLA